MSQFSHFITLFLALFALSCQEKRISVVQIMPPLEHPFLSALSISDEITLVTSDDVLDRAIADADLQKRWSLSSNEVRNLLKTNIQVTHLKNTSFLNIESSHKNEEEALIMASSVAEAFCKIRNESEAASRQKILTQLETELEEQKNSVQDSRKSMIVFIQQYGFPPSREQHSKVSSFYEDTFSRHLAQQRLHSLESQKATSTKRIQALEEVQKHSPSPLATTLLNQFRTELELSETQIDEMTKIQGKSGAQPIEAEMLSYQLDILESTYLRETELLKHLKLSQQELRRLLLIPYQRASIHSSARAPL